MYACVCVCVITFDDLNTMLKSCVSTRSFHTYMLCSHAHLILVFIGNHFFLFYYLFRFFSSFSSIISFIFLFIISPPLALPRRNNELIHSVNRNSVFTIILRNTIFLFTFNKVCSLLLCLAWNPITLCKTSPTDNQTEDETGEKKTYRHTAQQTNYRLSIILNRQKVSISDELKMGLLFLVLHLILIQFFGAFFIWNVFS